MNDPRAKKLADIADDHDISLRIHTHPKLEIPIVPVIDALNLLSEIDAA